MIKFFDQSYEGALGHMHQHAYDQIFDQHEKFHHTNLYGGIFVPKTLSTIGMMLGLPIIRMK